MDHVRASCKICSLDNSHRGRKQCHPHNSCTFTLRRSRMLRVPVRCRAWRPWRDRLQRMNDDHQDGPGVGPTADARSDGVVARGCQRDVSALRCSEPLSGVLGNSGVHLHRVWRVGFTGRQIKKPRTLKHAWRVHWRSGALEENRSNRDVRLGRGCSQSRVLSLETSARLVLR